jgi:FAD:protein FMN transferase
MRMMCAFLPLAVAGALLGAPALDRVVLAMGTRLTVHLEGAPEPRLQEASNAALAEVARLEEACSTWRPESPWSQLNSAKGEPRPLAAEWLDLLAQIQAWNRRTEGAFDPVLLALLRAWGVREGGRTPSPDELARARRASGSALLVLDRNAGTARLTDPEAGVEEGGFLKGYALDAALKVLQAQAIPSGWLDFGGQVLAWGAPLAVPIADPCDRQRPRLRVRLAAASLSSSGCAERGRHILDPRTGQPCPDWGAVSVVAERGLDADVLSTALYVKGPRAGLAYARKHGLAAAFLLHGGTVLQSPAFAAFTVTP